MKNKEKFLVQLTLEELLEVLDSRYMKNDDKPTERVTGIAGIAQVFNCSTATAQRIKSSGIIDEAISQFGRTFVVDVDKALRLVGASSTVWAKKYK